MELFQVARKKAMTERKCRRAQPQERKGPGPGPGEEAQDLTAGAPGPGPWTALANKGTRVLTAEVAEDLKKSGG